MNNGICSITISGNKVLLRFGIPANREFFKAMEERPDILIEDSLNEVGISVLLYCGYRNACLVNDEPVILKNGSFVEYVEQAIIDEEIKLEMNEAVQCYTNSVYTEKYTEQIHQTMEDLKKKVPLTGAKSKSSVTDRSGSQRKNTMHVPSPNSPSSRKRLKKIKKKK